MSFVSPEFLLFFPLVVGAFYALPHAARPWFLLGASYAFYAFWRVEYLGLILVSTAVDWAAARGIESAASDGRRRLWLGLSLLCNLGLLGFFKYWNFAASSGAACLRALGVEAEAPLVEGLLLPVGISFYTFQSLGYTIDVYRREIAAERSFARVALYVAYFPQLVAGPIERAGRLLPQLASRVSFDEARVVRGLRRMAWGFFLKLVLADRLFLYVRHVDSLAAPTPTGELWGLWAYAYAIFADFVAYTAIARGAALVLGVELSENFRRPLWAPSMAEFWRRWHISLTSWIRDYVYRPLGGSRRGAGRWVAHVLLVFLLCGLWHGADVRWACFGLIHAVYLIVGRWTRPWRERLWSGLGAEGLARPRRLVAGFCTFQLFALSLLPVRSASWGEGLASLQALALGWEPRLPAALLASKIELGLLLLGVGALELAQVGERRGGVQAALGGWPWPLRWVADYLLVATTVLLGVYEAQEFYYFQF